MPKAQAFLTFSLMKTPLTLELSAVFYMHRGFATAKAEQRRKMRVQEYSGKSHNTNPNETKSEGFFAGDLTEKNLGKQENDLLFTAYILMVVYFL